MWFDFNISFTNPVFQTTLKFTLTDEMSNHLLTKNLQQES